MKEIYSRHLYSSQQSCAATHNHPKTSQTSIWTPDHLYRIQIATVLQKSSQQKQTTQLWLVLNMKFISLFIQHSVHDEKLNLLTWALILVLDRVTFIDGDLNNEHDCW